jgi:hypothetical protein
MNILVLCTDYPDHSGGIALAYIRTRNIYYKKNGIDVDVLNFKANIDYILDDIHVFNLNYFYKNHKKYDILVCHAPNIRNHYIFIRKNQKKFDKIVFFFHGHEVLNVNKAYAKPYYYLQARWIVNILQECYDIFKLTIWHFSLPRLSYKSEFVFVSYWMLNEFKKWTRIREKALENRIHIIYNNIGSVFEEETYNKTNEKLYDFITIRPNLDGSKYAIDIVNIVAEYNPEYKFLVIGKGNFFSHYAKAPNIIWLQEYLTHSTMIDLMNQSKCALMPTRTDAQGVSMCEMATFDIPLITSDIPVCHEVFDGFYNVTFIDNENPATIDIGSILKSMVDISLEKNKKYFSENTISKEIKLFRKIKE